MKVNIVLVHICFVVLVVVVLVRGISMNVNYPFFASFCCFEHCENFP